MTSTQNSFTTHRDVAQEILRAVEALKQGSGFGSVEVIVHDGRVTQIEKREKLRFQQAEYKLTPTVKNSG